MHWLGMIIGKLGGEPNMKPAPYPYDPTSRKTIFQSYVAYEEKLIPHYMAEAARVDDPHIKRVLEREAWESEMHARKFSKIVNKLTEEEAGSLPGEENELPQELMEKIQDIVVAKYNQMIQALRNAWVFQSEDIRGWQMMDFSMTKMKQLAHMAEETAENGVVPAFKYKEIHLSATVGAALEEALKSVKQTRQRHADLMTDEEAAKHKGLMMNLDLSVKQEDFEAGDLEDWLKG